MIHVQIWTKLLDRLKVAMNVCGVVEGDLSQVSIGIPIVGILIGLAILTNVANVPRLWYEAIKTTYHQMKKGVVNRIGRTKLLPMAVLPFSVVRFVMGGAIVGIATFELIRAV
jgi:hypothetical protein